MWRDRKVRRPGNPPDRYNAFEIRGVEGDPVFERFTDRARRVLVLAQEEARLLNHSFIGTEHILLGLIAAGIRNVFIVTGFRAEAM